MTSQASLLIDLLNDDTFLKWIKCSETLPTSEKKRWDQWLEQSSQHKEMVQHAKKILDMPFREVTIDCTSSGELDRLLESLD